MTTVRNRRINESRKKRINILQFFRIVILVIIIISIMCCLYYLSKITYELSIVKKNDPLESSKIIDLTKQEGVDKTAVIIEGGDKEITSIYIFITNKESARTLAIHIPPWVYVDDYSNSFESYYPARSIIYSGYTINPEKKYEYAIWQIENLTAINVDSYIIIGDEAVQNLNKAYGIHLETEDKQVIIDSLREFSILKTIVNYSNFKPSLDDIYSNLTLVELYKTIESLKNYIVFADIENTIWIDISDPAYWSEYTLETSEVVKKYNSSAVDLKIEENIDIIRNKDLQKELVKVEVFNGSGLARAAERYSRKINNAGCTVVRFGNAPEELEKTRVYIMRPEDFPSSLEVVRSILGDDVEIIQERPSFMTTGDIIIVLGHDISEEGAWSN